ncbi:MAG: hypothetical protein ACRDT8_05840, partial [Micromonosporaceae bacterium]
MVRTLLTVAHTEIFGYAPQLPADLAAHSHGSQDGFTRWLRAALSQGAQTPGAVELASVQAEQALQAAASDLAGLGLDMATLFPPDVRVSSNSGWNALARVIADMAFRGRVSPRLLASAIRFAADNGGVETTANPDGSQTHTVRLEDLANLVGYYHSGVVATQRSGLGARLARRVGLGRATTLDSYRLQQLEQQLDQDRVSNATVGHGPVTLSLTDINGTDGQLAAELRRHIGSLGFDSATTAAYQVSNPANRVVDLTDATPPAGDQSRFARYHRALDVTLARAEKVTVTRGANGVARVAFQHVAHDDDGNVLTRRGTPVVMTATVTMRQTANGVAAAVESFRARPDAELRGQGRPRIAPERTQEVETAARDALGLLTHRKVGLLDTAAVTPQQLDESQSLVGRTVTGRDIEVPIGELMRELAESGLVGRQLQAQATGMLTHHLTETLRGQLDPSWNVDPDVAAARALARAGKVARGALRGEYRAGLRLWLEGMSVQQLTELRAEQLTRPQRFAVRQRLAEALLAEATPNLAGPSDQDLALRAELLPSGQIDLTGSGRALPAAAVNEIVEWLHTRLVDGADPHRIRAELAVHLGKDAALVIGRPGVVGALSSLARLHESPEADQQTRAAVEDVTREVVLDYPPSSWPEPGDLSYDERQVLPSWNLSELPPAALVLVERFTPGVTPEQSEFSDPYVALRPGTHTDLMEQIARGFELAAAEQAEQGGVTPDAVAIGNWVAGPVRRMTQSLDEAAEQLDDVVRMYRLKAVKAQQRARAEQEKIEAERDRTDRGSRERERKATENARKAESAANMHLRAAGRYQEALRQLRSARDAYQEVGNALRHPRAGRFTPTENVEHADRVQELMLKATAAYREYRVAWQEATPTQAALHAATLVGPLSNIAQLTATVNWQLEQAGVDTSLAENRVSENQLDSAIRAQFRVVVNDGVLIRVGADGTAGEVVLRLQKGDLVAMPGESSETIGGELHQAGRSGSTIRTWARDFSAVLPLSKWLELTLQDDGGWQSFVKQTTKYVVLRLSGRLGREGTLSSSAGSWTQGGGVLNNRGPSSRFSLDGAFVVEARDLQGSLVRESVPVGDPLQLHLPDLLAEPGPAPDETFVVEPGKPPKPGLPPGSVVGLTGLVNARDAVLELVGNANGVVRDPDAMGELRRRVDALILGDLPSHLDGPIDRPIVIDGHRVGSIRLEPTISRVTPVGGYNDNSELHGEDLAVTFEKTGSTMGGARSASLEGTVGVKASRVSQTSYTHGMGSGVGQSLTQEDTAINVEVLRTRQGTYQADIAVRAVWRPVTGPEADSGPLDLTGLLGAPAADALRANWPVHQEAVQRDQNGNPLRHPDGTVRLSDDPEPGPPPGKSNKVPHWAGAFAMFRNITGVYGTGGLQEQLIDSLTKAGLLTGPGDPNLREVAEFFRNNAKRMRANVNIAEHDGLPLVLERKRKGELPERVTLLVKM